MRRALAIAAGAVLLLVGLYAAAGYWLAPRFLRDALVDRAAQRGVELQVATVRTDPFTLRVTLEGIDMRVAGGEPFASARTANADLAWSSLWRRTWIIDEAALEQPQLNTERMPALGGGGRKDDGNERPSVLVRSFTVERGTLQLPQSYTVQGLNAQVHDLSTQAGTPGRYSLSAQFQRGGEISSQGNVSLADMRFEGSFRLTALPASRLWQPVEGRVKASGRYVYDESGVVLHDVVVEGSSIAYAGARLAHVRLSVPRTAVPPNEPITLSAKAGLEPQGEVTAEGTVRLQPFEADLKVDAGQIALTEVQPWLPDDVRVRITSGSLAAQGTLRLAVKEQSVNVAYEGASSVRDLRLEDGGSGKLLLAWRRADTPNLSFQSGPYRIDAGEIQIDAPEGRLIIEEDGSVNLVAAFAGQKETKEAPAFEVGIKRLGIENGTLHFADRSLETPFEVLIRELAGSVVGFSTETGDPARVQLAGRVARYGSARIRGTINLDAPRSLAVITANFRNLPLEAFNPYVVKFAGYRISSGRLSAQLRYEVRDGQLRGRNDLVFERIQLGEKLESGALDLPLELAVALLADPQGRINLDIPVSGNLNDPQFDFGAIIARAFANVVKRIVTAPFRALASLFGKGGEDASGEVRFEAGRATLAPPAEEHIARIAKALQQRPQLGVTVRGGYDPERDLEALRVQSVRREIAQRAGVTADGGASRPLDIGERAVLEAAERLYLERIGSRLELQSLREKEKRYGAALVRTLAGTVPVDQSTLQTLARARAESVRAALLAHGVDPSRVRVEEPVERKADKSGIGSPLSLTVSR